MAHAPFHSHDITSFLLFLQEFIYNPKHLRNIMEKSQAP